MENKPEETDVGSNAENIMSSINKVSDASIKNIISSITKVSEEATDSIRSSSEVAKEAISSSQTDAENTSNQEPKTERIKNPRKRTLNIEDVVTSTTSKLTNTNKDLVVKSDNKPQDLTYYEQKTLENDKKTISIFSNVSKGIELLKKSFDKDRLSELEAAREQITQLGSKKETPRYELGKVETKAETGKGPISSLITSALDAFKKPLADGLLRMFGNLTSKVTNMFGKAGSTLANMIGLGGGDIVDEADDLIDDVGVMDTGTSSKRKPKKLRRRDSKKLRKQRLSKKSKRRKKPKTRRKGRLGKVLGLGTAVLGTVGVSRMMGGDANVEDQVDDVESAVDATMDTASTVEDVADVADVGGDTVKQAVKTESTVAKTAGKSKGVFAKTKGAIGKVGDKVKGFFGKTADKAKGLFGKTADKAKGLFGKGASAAKGIGGKVGGLFGKLKSGAQNLAKGKLGKIVSKFGPKIGGTLAKAVGPIISVITSAVDLYNTVKEAREEAADDPKKAKEKVGLSIAKGIGKIGGSVVGGFAGTLLPVPGVGTIIGSLAGDFVGGFLGEQVGKILGGEKIYDILEPILKPLGLSIDVEDAQKEKDIADQATKQSKDGEPVPIKLTDEEKDQIDMEVEMNLPEDTELSDLSPNEQQKRTEAATKKVLARTRETPEQKRARAELANQLEGSSKGGKGYQPTPKPAAPSKESSTSQSISVNEAAKTAGQPTKQAAAGVNQINVSNSSNSYSSDSGTARFPAPEMMRRRT